MTKKRTPQEIAELAAKIAAAILERLDEEPRHDIPVLAASICSMVIGTTAHTIAGDRDEQVAYVEHCNDANFGCFNDMQRRRKKMNASI